MTASSYGDMGTQQGIKGLENGVAIGGKFRIFTGDGTPAATFTAKELGDLYMDYTNAVLYIASATGTGSWTAFAGLATMATGATIGGTSIFTKAGAADATAIRIGDLSIDYTNGALYMANATGASDWQRIAVTSTTGTPFSLSTTADAKGLETFFTSAATSGTSYGWKNTLTGAGIGAEFIGGRDRCILTAAAGNAHGYHGTLEVKNTGYVTGLGTGIRGNIVFSTDTVVANGTYYGVLAEIFPIGNTGALPAGSNACLCCNANSGTASDLVVNAVAFNGADGSGKMLYTHSITVGATAITSVRVRVNGVVGYMYVYSAA
jgi:hypothetical protein